MCMPNVPYKALEGKDLERGKRTVDVLKAIVSENESGPSGGLSW